MSDDLTPQVRALLDRLEPPALTADFADRVLVQAEAQVDIGPALPPLPRLRKPALRRGRRIALAVGIAGLVSVAAAAAVVPADVWRQVPVIGGIVELMSPARTEQAPAPVPAQVEEVPAVPAVSEAVVPEAAPPAERETRPVPASEDVASIVEPRTVVAPPSAEDGPAAARSEPIERFREAPPQPERAPAVAERPLPVETRPAAATIVDRVAAAAPERAPERISPVDTRETRQQTRERATDTRQATRERIERRERRANRTD